MHLIADSGSTKTSWKIAGKGDFSLTTIGFNPMIQSSENMSDGLLVPELLVLANAISKIHFFGAGCSNESAKTKMKNCLKQIFKTAEITIFHDMDAAAIALFGSKNGIACILGTGSNICEYNDGKIIQHFPSLGHILGDDGGGVDIGKIVLKKYVQQQQPWQTLLAVHGLTTDPKIIVSEIYNTAKPNTYIAAYAKVAFANIDNPVFYNIIKSSLQNFFTNQVYAYTKQEKNIGFVGSIAFFAQSIIKELCLENDLKFVQVIQSPIDNLVAFYEK